MPTYVSLDLETTGLSAEHDAITEIGAVKFKNGRVEDTYQQLVNPGRKIPPKIIELTGITDTMVMGQPKFKKVLPDLVDFIGDAVIVGQNIRFDLSFLPQYLSMNDVVDTFDLATIMLPNAGRYNLGALGRHLKIMLPPSNTRHRALDDAKLTHLVYWRLYEQIQELPLEVLAEIVNLSRNVDSWDGAYAFQEALRTRPSRTVSRGAQADPVTNIPLFEDKEIPGRALKPVETPEPLDIDAITHHFVPSGTFDQAIPKYEFRQQQLDMTQQVAAAFSSPNHLLVEAATGTGKSMAYLTPAIEWAWQNEHRVVVSTNTINLQDQLVNKDLPMLRDALGIPFVSALLKGRSNYICPRRFNNIRARGPRNADEMRLLARMLNWLPTTETGDRTEIRLFSPGEREAWSRMSAEDEGCTTQRCSTEMAGICPFHRTRQTAENAHVIVVNHALLLADVAAEHRVLPDYGYLVVDEAHHLEAATTDGLSFTGRQGDFERRLRDLGGPSSGLLGRILTNLMAAVPPEKYAAVSETVNKAYNAISAGTTHSGNFFQTVKDFFSLHSNGQARGYDEKLRIVEKQRESEDWQDIVIAWENLDTMLKPMFEYLTVIIKALEDLEQYEIDEREEMQLAVNAIMRYFDEFATAMTGLVIEPDENRIYWLEMSDDGRRLALNAAPLNVGPLIKASLWETKASVVLTSATLTTANDFGYIRERLAAGDDVKEFAVGSPFDYKSHALVTVPKDMPEPTRDRFGYQSALEDGLRELLLATKGRALVLFTAYSHLRDTSKAIRKDLEDAGIAVYDQTVGASRHQLVEMFQASEAAVLMGTRSFWEGVDIPGDDLVCVAIAKLPFDVPTDPIIAARSETFDNSFNDYAVPEAILRFRQGFGRLIRTQYDHGLVVVFDKRVLTKQYGNRFLTSLPDDVYRWDGKRSQLPEVARRWLAKNEKKTE